MNSQAQKQNFFGNLSVLTRALQIPALQRVIAHLQFCYFAFPCAELSQHVILSSLESKTASAFITHQSLDHGQCGLTSATFKFYDLLIIKACTTFRPGWRKPTCLMIQSCVIYSNQHSVHSQEETQQQEETGGHHPLHHQKDIQQHVTLQSHSHKTYLFKLFACNITLYNDTVYYRNAKRKFWNQLGSLCYHFFSELGVLRQIPLRNFAC